MAGSQQIGNSHKCLSSLLKFKIHEKWSVSNLTMKKSVLRVK